MSSSIEIRPITASCGEKILEFILDDFVKVIIYTQIHSFISNSPLFPSRLNL